MCMDWVLITAMAFAAWAAMSLLGNERQKRLEEQNRPAAAVEAIPEADPMGHHAHG